MSRIFFTSDLHLGHDKPFIYEARGFENIEEHDIALINNWNKIVSDDDDVFLLGDVVVGSIATGINHLKMLRGKIHIVRGNHDTDAKIAKYLECKHVVEVAESIRLKVGHRTLLLTHYPLMIAGPETPNMKTATINLYGHTHQTSNFYEINGVPYPFMYHVGMDSHEMKPILLEDILTEVRSAKVNVDSTSVKSPSGIIINGDMVQMPVTLFNDTKDNIEEAMDELNQCMELIDPMEQEIQMLYDILHENGLDKEVTERRAMLKDDGNHKEANTSESIPISSEPVVDSLTVLNLAMAQRSLKNMQGGKSMENNNRTPQLHHWYIQYISSFDAIGHGIVSGHNRLPDGSDIHTSNVQSLYVNWADEELIMETKNTVYHCPLASCNFNRQDYTPDIVPDYDRIREKYMIIPTIEPGKVLLALDSNAPYYFHSLYCVPADSPDGIPVEYEADPHIGTFMDSFLVYTRDFKIDLRYFPYTLALIKFYSENTGGMPLYLENIGNQSIEVETSIGKINLDPGERKEVCEASLEPELSEEELKRIEEIFRKKFEEKYGKKDEGEGPKE